MRGVLAAAGVFMTIAADAAAAEIKVLGTQSMVLVWNEIAPKFEQQTGHTVSMTPHIAATAKRMIDAGERFDVAILTPAVIDQLIKESQLIANTRTDIMRVGIGVAVRAGQDKPDISSVEAFKNTLLNAKSIAYLKTGVSGIYLSELMKRLGIAEDLKSKTILPEGDVVGPMVARGEAQMGITAMSTLRATPGLEIVGPLPPEIQSYVTFTGGVSTSTTSPDAGRDLLQFLTSPAALPAMRAKGLEPS